MSFNPNAKPTEVERELIPEGAHIARCVRVIEIGKHLSGFPPQDGKEEYPKEKAVIVFSLPNVIREFGDLGEKQAFISNPFGITMSSNEKATMRKYAKALDPRGESENLGGFVNQPCQLAVIHKERKDKPPVAVIDSVAPILPGIEVPEADTETFWSRWDQPDVQILRMVPEFTRNLIKEALNYPDSPMERAMLELEAASGDSDEDVPF